MVSRRECCGAVSPGRPIMRSGLVGLAIGQLGTLVILTVISMVRLTPRVDEKAGRSFDECHEHECHRIRCNPCA